MESHDDFLQKCGELFFTMKGNLIFLCTLCDDKYHNFNKYFEHLLEEYSKGEKNNVVLTNHIAQNMEEININTIIEEDIGFVMMDNLEERAEDEIILEHIENNIPWKTDNIVNEINKIENSEPKTICEPQDNQNSITTNQNNERDRILLIEKKSINKKEHRMFNCPDCAYTTHDKSNYLGHVKRHSNNKQHQCSECEKSFHTRTELKSHLRRHRGEKPFLCTDCGLSFYTSGLLTTHVKRHKNLRDKECKVCHKRFFDGVALQNHIRVHSGERPFKCTLCPSRFKRNNALASHMNMHANKREYMCEFCPAKFNQKSNLTSHRKSKHLISITTNVKS